MELIPNPDAFRMALTQAHWMRHYAMQCERGTDAYEVAKGRAVAALVRARLARGEQLSPKLKHLFATLYVRMNEQP